MMFTGLENIQVQIDDPAVKQLQNEFGKLIEASGRFKSGLKYFKSTDTKTIIDNIDRIIYKRFGFYVKHVNSPGSGYGVIFVPPVGHNVLSGDILELKNNLDNMLKTCDSNGKCGNEILNKKDKIDSVNDVKAIMFRMKQSYDNLTKQLKTKGIVVDRKKAVIKNIPNDYNIFLLVDFFVMIKHFGLDKEELTAAVIHEIGHQFTAIENSIRTTKTTTILLDTMLDGLANGKPHADTIKIMAKDAYGEELSDKSHKKSVIKFINTHRTHYLNEAQVASDAEVLADQFAARFGLGKALTSALSKTRIRPPWSFILLHYNVAISYSLISYIMFGNIMVSLGIFGMLVYLTYSLIYKIDITEIVTGGSKAKETTYDNVKRRFIRIRNDMVRQLRTTDLPKAHVAKILEDLDSIMKMAETTINNETIFAKFGNILPWNQKNVSETELLEKLEDLTENELHVHSKRLEQYI